MTVVFPLCAASGIRLPLETLVDTAPLVGDCIAQGDTDGLRKVLDGLRIPREVQSEAIQDFAVGLSLSGVGLFNEDTVRSVAAQMRQEQEKDTYAFWTKSYRDDPVSALVSAARQRIGTCKRIERQVEILAARMGQLPAYRRVFGSSYANDMPPNVRAFVTVLQENGETTLARIFEISHRACQAASTFERQYHSQLCDA